ncbi:hypothetical protein LCGC14_1685070 [marine sediment metagenome]|uniref:Uncharacterized protein n=1 Tax=marine sediment metagenome TaxID=412755 RepID=A0A0F9KMK5_9ZZZZ
MEIKKILHKLFGIETKAAKLKKLKKEREEIKRGKELKRKEKKVFKVTFRCESCSQRWSYKYPADTRVGYSGWGQRSNKHSWIMDTYGFYNYHCPTCNSSDISIIKRNVIKFKDEN